MLRLPLLRKDSVGSWCIITGRSLRSPPQFIKLLLCHLKFLVPPDLGFVDVFILSLYVLLQMTIISWWTPLITKYSSNLLRTSLIARTALFVSPLNFRWSFWCPPYFDLNLRNVTAFLSRETQFSHICGHLLARAVLSSFKCICTVKVDC
ncbi:hypothetical protein AVEN_183985-1 [Araneus ventricosus]|uniref:Uncharacterized protein n=1 Tax=Araneus ventricosus TaxID=182803 RepID=A0A4Y2E1N2_ARAVE|nr:hypothetical protein AVEN_183985-1 [Araneus ventricosus]